MQSDITSENEIEFEINLTAPEMDIKIVDKPRVHLVDEMESDSHFAAETQFSLFETPAGKIADEIDNQDLERDLIKRITLDMQKHQISLYELEKNLHTNVMAWNWIILFRQRNLISPTT